MRKTLVLAIVTGMLLAGTANVEAGELLFYEDFEDALNQNHWPAIGSSTGYPEITNTHARNGSKSAKFELTYVDNTTYRQEIKFNANVINGGHQFEFGETYWFGWSDYTPTDFEDSCSGIMFQMHATRDLPPRCQEYDPDAPNYETWRNPVFAFYEGTHWNGFVFRGDSRQCNDNDYEYQETGDLGDPGKGQWTDWVLKWKPAYDNTGIFQVWKNEIEMVNFTDVKTCFNDLTPEGESGLTLRFAIYAYGWKGDNPAPADKHIVRYIDEFRLGGSDCCYADVVPGGAIPDSPISQDAWELEYVDSQETVGDDGYAVNAFDGDPDTFWSTAWYNIDPDPPHPHEIQIDLGGFYDICGFRYLPRQDDGPGDENGMIKDYEFYVSSDAADWGTAIASGTWTIGKMEKQVSFDCKLGKYVRLVALNEVEGRAWTTMAELNVLAVQPDTDINNDGKINLEDFAVLSTWWDDENACSSPNWCEGADFDMNGIVNMSDLTYFAENWLR